MDFKNKQSPKISDSKAYGQWESIMKNSGWFENEQQSGEYEMDKVSNFSIIEWAIRVIYLYPGSMIIFFK